MQVVVLVNDPLKTELTRQGVVSTCIVEWIDDINNFARHPDADAYVDLLPGMKEYERLKNLSQHGRNLIIVNDVIRQQQQPAGFVRINGWPTMLERSIIEASAAEETARKKAEMVFACFNKKVEWVPDIPGFISARVIAMVINEAYFAMEEGVSSKEEIDTAMKLGTNYPYGPFEWCNKIGVKNISRLLKELSGENNRYSPSSLLEKEAGN